MTTSAQRLPVFRDPADATLRKALARAAQRVIESGRFALDTEVAAFEDAFAASCGVSHCVSVANGTDALELALRAVGVQAGARVITAANAGCYASTAIRAIGAVPLYADVDEFLCLDPLAIAPLASQAAAIVVTHLYGRMAAVEAIAGIGRRHGIPLIEDCAQAHGVQLAGRYAGTFGLAGCFSFYPTKNLGALGDGGAVVTGDSALAQRVRSLRQYGWSPKYNVERGGGRNSRLDEIQAAFLREKLPYLARWNAARVAIARRYVAGLAGLPLQPPEAPGIPYNAHLFVVRCDVRDALRDALSKDGIETALHYPVPDHRQPVAMGERHASLPMTEGACREVLTLPCFPGMTDGDVDRVITAIRNFWHGHDTR